MEGEKLTVSQIYKLVTLFNATLIPLRNFIVAILQRTEVTAAVRRINKLIQVEQFERLEDDTYMQKGEIEIFNGNFNWEDPKYYKMFEGKEMSEEVQSNMILKDIDLSIKKGEFIAVVGKVGSGKSSLLLAMMNEMVRQKGIIKKNGKIAYISQETILFNDTILNNVIFGNRFDREKFDRCLDICQMRPDLEIMPGKEFTEIGERGINMSGGQKQRVNIARAVYSDSDIYLIDDALSALDAYVGKKIMEDVFKKELKGKTRIMVTHYLHLLDSVDKVLLIDKGEIKAFGSYDEVRKSPEFKEFAEEAGDGDDEEENTITEKISKSKEIELIKSQLTPKALSRKSEDEIERRPQIIESVMREPDIELKSILTQNKKQNTEDEKEKKGKLTKEEKINQE